MFEKVVPKRPQVKSERSFSGHADDYGSVDDKLRQDQERWHAKQRQADLDALEAQRLNKLAESIKEPKMGTLDEIRSLLKSIEYGDMMRLATDLSVLLAQGERGDKDDVAAALHAYALTDQVPGAPPSPRESLSVAGGARRVYAGEETVPPPSVSPLAYRDPPADAHVATSPIPPGDEHGGGSPKARTRA